MSQTKYGRSWWIDTFPKSRVPSYPRHRGPLAVDIAVVGGGVTGCATAYAFAAAGIKVALVEADQVGRGSSGFSNGWISDDPGASFVAVERLLGLRDARRGWQAWRRAALDFAALVRRLDLKCSLTPRDTLIIATTAEQTNAMKREQKARRDAGLEVSAANARTIAAETAIGAPLGLKSREGATVDPYRLVIGLAAAAAARGAAVFERSPATRIRFGARAVEVQTRGGAIRADRVIVATGVPTPLFKPLARHFWFNSSFLALTAPVGAKVRQRLGRRAAVVRDGCPPPHIVQWTDDDRLLISGADAEIPPDRQRDKLRDKLIVQRTGQLMYELSTIYPDISGIPPQYGWEAPYARTVEGLPYIGPHRNFPRHLFAFGDSSHSLTGGYLASRVLLRHYLGEPDASDEVFAFTRTPR
jgi:glycine/D-amino acid oxidase-like deaminating enzyme